MPRFRFQAREPGGAPIAGEIEAEGPEAAVRELVGRGLVGIVVEGSEAPEGEDGPAAGKLTVPEARAFAQQVAGLSQAGLPLHSGLRALALEMPSGRLRRIISDLADRLERGDTLEQAMDELGHRLPDHLRDLIRAGSRSGQVGSMLSQFVRYAEFGRSVRRSVWLTLLYPALAAGAFFAILVLLSHFVIRPFEEIFKDFGMDLPLLTIWMIQIGRGIVSAGWGVLWVPPLVLLMGWALGKILLDDATKQAILSRLPLLGTLWRWSALAEFSHFLALLLEARIPLPDAVPIAAEGANDAELVHAGQIIAEEVRAGAGLAQAAASTGSFPHGYVKIVSWAEGSRSLPQALHIAGEMFAAFARARASLIGSVLSVSVIVLILWGVAFVVISMFLPLLTLISSLSG